MTDHNAAIEQVEEVGFDDLLMYVFGGNSPIHYGESKCRGNSFNDVTIMHFFLNSFERHF